MGDQQLLGHDLTVAFGGVTVVDGVEVRLDAGRILGLIGPNGAGKTTLVNVLTGFQRPAAGRVVLNGRDITGEPPHKRVPLGLARTFQGGRVFSELTVVENVEVAALRGGFSRGAARREALVLVERLGLAPQAEVYASSLSFGFERRLGLARAIASRPQFLILDEPAAGLDEVESAELRRTIAEFRDEHGCGILLIEHDTKLIMELCDEVQVIDYGRTIACGGPEAVRSDAAVIEAYLGAFA